MGQIHGPNLGSPACLVTSAGELFVSLASGGTTLNIDSTDSTLVTVNETFKQLHLGNHYVSHNVINSTDPGSFCFVVETPSGLNAPNVHMNFEVTSTGILEIKEFENVTSSGGTPSIPINSNRQSANTSQCSVAYNPDITSSGLLLGEWAFGVDNNKVKTGGDTSRLNEIILSPGSKYAWCMETTSAEDIIINADGFWYEH